MRFCAFLALVWSGFIIFVTSCERDSSSKLAQKLDANTNVFLVTLDTTRADRLGCYGHARAGTPALDALAARGTLFEDAHTTVPLTLPSHATILTGRYPREHGLRVNGKDRLGTAHPTLATIFRDKGYATGAFVSSYVLDKRFGLDRGFGTYDDQVNKNEHGDILEAERPADAVTARALAWLKSNSSGPFFCWLHYYDPHEPYVPPQEFRNRHPNPYDGEIAFMDSELGRVLDWLKSSGVADRTLIVVAGDHGESLGEHGELGHTTFLYETNVAVPLMFVHPSAINVSRVATAVSLVDVFPTILDLFDFPQPEGLMGKSLIPYFSGEKVEPQTSYAESDYALSVHGWAQQRAMITDEWKYISSTRPELFDRRTDRGETRNLFAERFDVAQSLQAQLEDLYARMTPGAPAAVAQSQEALKRLESLGYVAGRKSKSDEVLTPGLIDPKDMVDVIVDLQTAHRMFEEKKVAEAIPLLEKARQRSPDSEEILYRLGRGYMSIGRTAEAIETLKKAVELDPQNPRGLRTLADAFSQANRLPEAAEHYELLNALLPDDAQVLLKLGTVLLEMHRVDNAITRFQQALKHRPDYGDAMIGLGNAMTRKGAFDDAEAVLQKATTIPGSQAQAYFMLGRLAAARNNPEKALEHHEKAVELKPGHEQAVQGLTEVYLKSGRTKDAVRVLRRALELSPGNVPMSLTLVEIMATSKYDELRNGAEAVRMAEALVAGPAGSNMRAVNALAAAKAETGDFESAVQLAEKAIFIAKAGGNERFVPMIQSQLEAYRARKPFRSTVF